MTESDAPQVILVDPDDGEIGIADKMDAHRRGVLHRAVSVFAFDERGAMLLQRRSWDKYHSGGLWSNSACTHPRVGESLDEAARRCLREELGVECTALEAVCAFTYKAAVSDELVEHELDHVFVGTLAGLPVPDPREVAGWRLVMPNEVRTELARAPETFTAWFPIAWQHIGGPRGHAADPARQDDC